MKVLFLDIDGVLNSAQSARFWHRNRDQKLWENELYEGWEGSLKGYLAQEFCPIACQNLTMILEELSDLKIVVSSTWRIGETVESLKKILSFSDLVSNAIISTTPVHRDDPRGLEIQAWLDEHKNHGKVNEQVSHFVIVDDDADMEHLVPHLVQTDNRVGLDYNKAWEIIKRFRQYVAY